SPPLNLKNSSTLEILISLKLNKKSYIFDLPNEYINSFIIPSIMIPYEILSEIIDSNSCKPLQQVLRGFIQATQ
ncbi:MAG: hypothetical protein LBE31_11695, partial [Deltaproteobacteria bacterium]|nr:hypothetical protein [Deltaproteobacteria bacterium]